MASRRQYAGNAPATVLQTTMTASTPATIAVSAGTGTNYPDGSVGPFFIVIDRGTIAEEKILMASRASDTFTISARGQDGTNAASHVSGAAVFEHVITKTDADEANAHITVTSQDDHTQYLNVARHDLVARHGTANLDMAAITALLTPPGMMAPYGGASAPTGWLLCDGSAVSRATYATLFGVLSTTYGVGDGSTTFNLPDLRQKFPMGKAASGTGNTLGGTGGSKDAVAVSHGHPVTDPTHNHTQNQHLHAITDNQHTHGTTESAHRHGWNGDTGARFIGSEGGQANGITGTNVAQAVNIRAMDTASTGLSVNNGATGISVNNQTPTNVAGATNLTVNTGGVSGTDANLPAYQVVNYIVKT